MSNKKKTQKVGTIKAEDLLKSTRGVQNIGFRSGKHMTEKDRPRKKVTTKNMHKYM